MTLGSSSIADVEDVLSRQSPDESASHSRSGIVDTPSVKVSQHAPLVDLDDDADPEPIEDVTVDDDVPVKTIPPRSTSPTQQLEEPQQGNGAPLTPPLSPILASSPWQSPSGQVIPSAPQAAQTQTQSSPFSFRVKDKPLFRPTQMSQEFTQSPEVLRSRSPRSPPKSQSLKNKQRVSLAALGSIDRPVPDNEPEEEMENHDLEITPKQVTAPSEDQKESQPFTATVPDTPHGYETDGELETTAVAGANAKEAESPTPIPSQKTKRIDSSIVISTPAPPSSHTKRPSREERAAIQRDRVSALASTPKARARTPAALVDGLATPKPQRGRKVTSGSRPATPTVEPLSDADIEWAGGAWRLLLVSISLNN